MQTRPQNWSHHHIHRLFHISQLAAFSIIIAALISGSLSVWGESQANTIDATGTINITGDVQSINPGPAVPVNNGGVVNPQTQQPASSEEPYVTIAPWTEQQLSQRNSEPIFPSSRIRFLGRSNIANAVIFLELTGPQNLRSTAYLNNDGLWFWPAPIPLPNGEYLVTATSQSQADATIKASSNLKFFIEAKADTVPGGPPKKFPPQASMETPNAIDIAVRIPERFKTIQPGDEFIVKLDFFQSAPPRSNSQIKVHYHIEDENHHSVMDNEEKFQIPGRLSLIKSFTTSASLKEGVYTLIVSIENESITTAASDTFTLHGPAILLLSSPTKINYTTALLILLSLVLLFALIAYYEYRKVAFLTQLIKHPELTN